MEYDSPHIGNYQERVNQWNQDNPGYKVITYNLKRIDEFVKEHMPQNYDHYSKMLTISKIDFWRYLVLYVHGGE